MHRRWTLTTALVVASLGTAGATAAETSLTPREIVERVGGAVVLIEAEVDGKTSQGSGFLVATDGAIVTCLHVIDGADRVRVSFRDGAELDDVAVRAFDVAHDLAVLSVDLPADGSAPAPVALGATEAVERGSRILVIGNPLGLEHTVTEGIVSAWREPGASPPDAPAGEGGRVMLPLVRLLQISASISPGSSGGPVIDDRARVIGVASSGVLMGMAGLNFAVPVDGLPGLIAADDAMDLATFGERVDDVRREIARPYYEDAEMEYGSDDLESAGRSLERALQIFPRYLDALLLSGRVALESGRIDLAQQRFESAVEIDDYSAQAWYGLGAVRFRKAAASGETAGLGSAETAFEKALDLDGRHGKAAYGLAVIQFIKGALDGAEELLAVAIENEPGFADAHYTLGEIHLVRGRLNDAQQAFERALWEDENHALSHFGLARMYMERDRAPHGAVSRQGDAPHHWEEFLRLSEGDPSLAEERDVALYYIKQFFPELLDR